MTLPHAAYVPCVRFRIYIRPSRASPGTKGNASMRIQVHTSMQCVKIKGARMPRRLQYHEAHLG